MERWRALKFTAEWPGEKGGGDTADDLSRCLAFICSFHHCLPFNQAQRDAAMVGQSRSSAQLPLLDESMAENATDGKYNSSSVSPTAPQGSISTLKKELEEIKHTK